jgi:hypothetical protein
LATFQWSDEDRMVAVTPKAPAAPAWSMSVRYEPLGDAMDASLPNHVQQVSDEGVVRRFDGTITGSMFAASVDVDGHADGPLGALLVPGHYDGTLISRCEFDVGPLND